MSSKTTVQIHASRRLLFLSLAVIAILTIPLIVMQFNKDVRWTGLDFWVAGFLLSATVLGIDLILRKIPNKNARVFSLLLVVIALLLIWAELAVGIFGSPIAGH